MGRHKSYTKYNHESSRSHFICKIFYNSNNQNVCLFIVDLAGSEKYNSSKGQQDKAKETISINKSLSELWNVIVNLNKENF